MAPLEVKPAYREEIQGLRSRHLAIRHQIINGNSSEALALLDRLLDISSGGE